MNKQKIPSIWDYDINSIDLSNPKIAKWYLKRRINYGDWKGLEYNLLKISSIKNLLNKNRNLFTLRRDSQTLKLEFVYFPFESLQKPRIIKEFNLKALIF